MWDANLKNAYQNHLTPWAFIPTCCTCWRPNELRFKIWYRFLALSQISKSSNLIMPSKNRNSDNGATIISI